LKHTRRWAAIVLALGSILVVQTTGLAATKSAKPKPIKAKSVPTQRKIASLPTAITVATFAPSTTTNVTTTTLPPDPESFALQAVLVRYSGQTVENNKDEWIQDRINSAESWFNSKTDGHSPRWIRSAPGVADVVHVDLPLTLEQLADMSMEQLLAETRKQLSTSENVRLVLWYDGPFPGYCGISGTGRGAVLYMSRCVNTVYLLVHELTHFFGAVPRCAPHYDDGHANDDVNDVVRSSKIIPPGTGPKNWDQLVLELTLDKDHDDYFMTNKPDCPGIEKSRYWTPGFAA
jgi:hypothetical protein